VRFQQLAAMLQPFGPPDLIAHVYSQHGRHREAVGEVEPAECGHRHIDVNRIEIVAKQPFGPAARDEGSDRLLKAGGAFGHQRRAGYELAVHHVLGAQQPLEHRVVLEIAEREIHQLHHTFERLFGVDGECRLLLPEVGIGRLKHRHIELLLAAEIMVQHPDIAFRRLGDLVDPGTRETVLGKFLQCGFHQGGTGARGVAFLGRRGQRFDPLDIIHSRSVLRRGYRRANSA